MDSEISETIITESSYQGENISIEITEYYENDTAIYVADIALSSAEYLQTAFTQNAYGKNVTEKPRKLLRVRERSLPSTVIFTVHRKGVTLSEMVSFIALKGLLIRRIL